MIISGNSIPVNIKFTFTVYKYILLPNLIYIIYINIIYIYIYIYIYIFINIYTNFVFFVYYNIVSTHAHAGLAVFTFIWSFPAGFTWSLSLVETVYEHDPSYQKRSQRSLVKTFFVIHGKVLTGFKHSFKKQLPKVFYKKICS